MRSLGLSGGGSRRRAQFAVRLALAGLLAASPWVAGSPERRAIILSAAVAQEARVFDLAIEGAALPEEQRLIRVKQNDHVTLSWTADAPVELHLHGYDIERALEPGAEPVRMEFDADMAGRFPVEAHDPNGDAAAGGGEVPLLYLEVYP